MSLNMFQSESHTLADLLAVGSGDGAVILLGKGPDSDGGGPRSRLRSCTFSGEGEWQEIGRVAELEGNSVQRLDFAPDKRTLLVLQGGVKLTKGGI